MASERDKSRVMIPVGTGIDEGRQTLKEGDDVPTSIDDAPNAIKALNQESQMSQGASAEPITLESIAKYLRALTTDPATKNVYAQTEQQVTITLDKVALNHPTENVFAPANVLATLDQHGVVSEMFDDDTLKKIYNSETGLHEIFETIVGNAQAKQSRRGGSPTTVGSRAAAVKLPSDASVIQTRISDVLKRNRFNPDPNSSPYMDDQSASSVDASTIGKFQTSLGSYDSSEGPNDQSNVTFEQMKKIGLALMLRATGAYTKNGSLTGSARIGTEAGAQVPGTAQLLATQIIEPKTMWASDLNDGQGIPQGAKDKPKLPSDITLDNSTYSYGNMNSYLAPFSGFAPLSTILLAGALVIAVKALIELLLLTISQFISGPTTSATPKKIIQPLGKNQNGQSLAGGLVTYADLGINPVKHDYMTAIDRGIDVFFQIDNAGDFVKVAKSPGYYAVMVRAIIRSGGTIVSNVKDQVGSLTNPISIVQALSGFIDTIKSSQVISFLNILASLGDSVLYLEENGYISTGALGEIGTLLPDGKVSYVDRLPNNPVTHVMKSRLNPNATRLAWETSATPSMYILPQSAIRAAAIISKDKSTLANVSNLDDAVINRGDKEKEERQVLYTNGRIDNESVKLIEDHLESEYVPFYFHDLRTNEIVSFHAFLASCDESYTVNYDKGKYYGRVDPVMIYSDTDRTINLSFHIVATSEKDFDVMWWKINKFMTLLYPQWSRGRKVEVDGNSFIQPFSQTPTSSPMIRLRLGDLFKSNYSKFALARLFGLGTDDFALNNAQTTIKEERVERLNKRKREIIERMEATPLEGSTNLGFVSGDEVLLRSNPARNSPLLTVGETKNPVVSARKYIQNTLDNLKCAITAGPFFGTTTVGTQTVKTTAYNIEVLSPPEGTYAGPYRVDFAELTYDPDFVDASAKKDLNYENEITVEQQAVDDFFKSENNVIVRSFESVRGRGLAGFITSLSTEWKAPTWETVMGSRAPQYCTFKISFQPIHDIAPGIDHDGFNRAPIYNVGATTREVGSDPYGDDKTASDINKANNDDVSKLFKSDVLGTSRR